MAAYGSTPQRVATEPKQMSIPSALDARAAEPADKRYIVRSPMRADLLRVVEMIEARFHEPLSLAQLALAAGLSRYRFVAVFRDEVGMTPQAYMNGTLIRHSAHRVRDHRHPAQRPA